MLWKYGFTGRATRGAGRGVESRLGAVRQSTVGEHIRVQDFAEAKTRHGICRGQESERDRDLEHDVMR